MLNHFEVEEAKDKTKPVMLVSEFTVYDPKHQFEMISIDSLEKIDDMDRHYHGAGLVLPHYEEMENEDLEDEIDRVYVELSAILRFYYEWEERDLSR
jgi:DNA (cytosine-5)-methyltransferase 1